MATPPEQRPAARPAIPLTGYALRVPTSEALLDLVLGRVVGSGAALLGDAHDGLVERDDPGAAHALRRGVRATAPVAMEIVCDRGLDLLAERHELLAAHPGGFDVGLAAARQLRADLLPQRLLRLPEAFLADELHLFLRHDRHDGRRLLLAGVRVACEPCDHARLRGVFQGDEL